MVSEWLAALCSVSGATTQTSPASRLMTFSSTFKPGAWMPSSLEIKTRALASSIEAADIALDGLHAPHVRLQRSRHLDSAISTLIVLQQGDQRAADSQAGAVQRVYEAGAFLALFARPRVHPPRLEVA